MKPFTANIKRFNGCRTTTTQKHTLCVGFIFPMWIFSSGWLVGNKLIILVADWETLVGWSIINVSSHFSWPVGKFNYFLRNHKIIMFVVVGD